MLIALLIIGLLLVWLISTRNKLVRSREMVRNSMGQISAQVESRWDAVKSLISATNKYSEHESEVLMDITRSRSQVTKDSNVGDIVKDEQQFNSAIGKIQVVAENYPELKASNVYENTMGSIKDFENNVRHSRMIYNDTVTKYNSQILTFPNSLAASIFNFKEEDYFSTTEGKENMPSWD